MMNRTLHREAAGLPTHIGRASCRAGPSSPDFSARPVGIGVASIVADFRPAGAAGSNLKGNVRFLVGPWSDGEVDHHKHIGTLRSGKLPAAEERVRRGGRGIYEGAGKQPEIDRANLRHR